MTMQPSVRDVVGVFLALVLVSAPHTASAENSARLNRLIEIWQQGKPVFGTFARFRDPDGAAYYASTKLDFVLFDTEHGAADFNQFKVFLQSMLDRAQILKKGNLQPNVVALARVPANGNERNQWAVKQVLDAGAYGLMSPHIANVEEARHIVASSRYPQKIGAPDNDPPGERGVAPGNPARYWGLPVPEYMERADLWPLDPNGEVTLVIMIEDREGVKNAREILSKVKGIAAVFIGPFDLSTSLGYPAQPDHPETERAIQSVLTVTKELNIACGILVTKTNLEKRVKQGFKFLVIAGTPGEVEDALGSGLKLSGRE